MPLTFPRSRVFLIGLVLLGLIFGLWLIFRGGISVCSNDTQQNPIQGSPWNILVEVDRCSALDGTVTVWGLNKSTGRKDEIAFIDEDAVPNVKVEPPNYVTLTFQNIVDIVRSKSSIGDLNIKYQFKPIDNPEARRRYQFWLHRPNDPQAIEWQKERFQTTSQ